MTRRLGPLLLAAALPLTLAPRQPAAGPGAPRTRTDPLGDPLPPAAVGRLGTFRLVHGGAVSSLAFARGGKALLSAGKDTPLRAWDPATGREVRPPAGAPGSASCLASSRDGRFLACADPDGVLRAWDTLGARLLLREAVDNSPCLALSPDGRSVAWSGADRVIHLRDLATGKARKLTGHHGPVTSLAFSPDGKSLASCGADRVSYWDLPTGKRLRDYQAIVEDKPTKLSAALFGHDGQSLYAAGEDGTIHVWELSSLTELRRLEGHEGEVTGLALSPDGRTLASAGFDGTLRLWGTPTGKAFRTLETGGTLTALCFSPDGKTLAAADDSGFLYLWDGATGKERSPAGPRAPFTTLAFADPRTLVAVTPAAILRHRLPGGKVVRRVRLPGEKPAAKPAAKPAGPAVLVLDEEPFRAVLSPDARLLALFANGDSGLRLLDATTGKETQAIKGEFEDEPLLAFSPDGRLLAASLGEDAGGLRVWDTSTGKERPPPGEKGSSLWVLAFSPDGRTLLTGRSKRRTLLRWELATGKQRRPFLMPPGAGPDSRPLLAVSPDGRLIALARGESVSLGSLATGKVVRRCDAHELDVGALAFSPRGKLLATGSEDCTVRLWDVATGRERACLRGHRGPVHLLAFSPDGGTLVSASQDTTALVWDVASALRLPRKPTPAPPPRPLPTLWAQLAHDDPAAAESALDEMGRSPERTVSFLKSRLRPVPPVPAERLARLVADLDSAHFEARDRATRRLERLAEQAGPALRQADARPETSAETRRRVRRLLDRLDRPNPSGEAARPLRAVEVLERLATPEARKLLEALSRGDPASHLTRDAKAALRRLGARE